MPEFLTSNVAAVIALAGVLVGGLVTGGISFFNAWVMRNRDFQLKLWERLLDRRIMAHEAVLEISLKMRLMVSFQRVDSAGELVRAPLVMRPKEEFDEWLGEFAEKSLPATTWLSTAVKRELNFVQDYLVTLHTKLADVSPQPQHCATVGMFIRQDFIDLSAELEKMTFKFFKSEMQALRLNDLTDWHKYPREETDKRLQNTALMRRWPEIAMRLSRT
jgi:hypothetical protein